MKQIEWNKDACRKAAGFWMGDWFLCDEETHKEFIKYLDSPEYQLMDNNISNQDQYIYATFNELVQILGNPTTIKHDYKTYADWIFKVEFKHMDGVEPQNRQHYITIYDYKDQYYEDGENFKEDDFKKELTMWHSGAARYDRLHAGAFNQYLQIILTQMRLMKK